MKTVNTSSRHLRTKSSQPLKLHTCITSSLFNLLATLTLHLITRARPLSLVAIKTVPCNMLHLDSGINSMIISISLNLVFQFLTLTSCCSWHCLFPVDSPLSPIVTPSLTPQLKSTCFTSTTDSLLPQNCLCGL